MEILDQPNGTTYVEPKFVGKPMLKHKACDDDSQIEFIVVKNDKSLSSMRNLIDLKNIIAKQLPRMPRNYIVRLTMDRQHEAILIRKRWPKHRENLPLSVSDDKRNKDGKIEIIGGCVFRPFPSQRFIEVVFLAIATKF